MILLIEALLRRHNKEATLCYHHRSDACGATISTLPPGRQDNNTKRWSQNVELNSSLSQLRLTASTPRKPQQLEWALLLATNKYNSTQTAG